MITVCSLRFSTIATINHRLYRQSPLKKLISFLRATWRPDDKGTDSLGAVILVYVFRFRYLKIVCQAEILRIVLGQQVPDRVLSSPIHAVQYLATTTASCDVAPLLSFVGKREAVNG